MRDSFAAGQPGTVVQRCPASPPEPHWIEIEMLGEDESPIPWEEYEITLPDGDIVRGYLDEDGWARVDNIEQPGACKIAFPRLDKEAWAKHATPTDGAKPQRDLG